MRAHWYTPKSVEALLQTIAGRDELVNCIQSEYPADSQVIKNTTDLRMFLAQLLSRDAWDDEFARFSKAFHGTGKASFKSGNAKRGRLSRRSRIRGGVDQLVVRSEREGT